MLRDIAAGALPLLAAEVVGQDLPDPKSILCRRDNLETPSSSSQPEPFQR